MKRISIILLVTLCTLSISAADKIYVSINKLYTENSGFILPDKTVDIKIPSISIANPKYDFTRQFSNIAKKIQGEDFENYVYAVRLKYAGVGISIDIEAKDIVEMKDTEFYGDFIVERSHFVLVKNDDNRDLLKTFFKKDKKYDVIFQQCFEMVSEVIERQPTIYKASYDERQRKITLNQFLINGNDKLNPQLTEPTTPETVTDDSDAFKIDVELFE